MLVSVPQILSYQMLVFILHVDSTLYSRQYYTDIDRDSHEISCFGGLPRELYFPKGYYFVPRENINILAPPTRDISSAPVDIRYIRWSKSMISTKFDGALHEYHKVW